MHPFPSFLVAALTVALVPLAERQAGASLYVQLGLGMLFFQFSIGATNDIIDREDDAIAKPWKPIPAGHIERRTADTVAVACGGLGLVATFGLSTTAWLIGLAGLVCGYVYDGWLKRTVLSWLPLAIAFPLIPVWVYTAAHAWEPVLWWVFPVGVLFAVAVHIANQLPDIEADAAAGSQGAPLRLGSRRAFGLALGAFGAGASIAVVVLAFVSPARGALGASASAIALLLAGRATALLGRDGLFGVLAVSSAVVAVVFLSAV